MAQKAEQRRAISESLTYYMTELVHQANLLEDIGDDNHGETLRDIAGQIEQLTYRISHTKRKRRPL